MKHFLLTVLFFLLLAFPSPVLSSQLSAFSFQLSALSSQPWLGGLNACQFGRMDLDGDGQKDLLVFDRHGNRLLCFLNRGGREELDYQYTTDYDTVFPKMKEWVVFADYDGDDKEDIFTFSQGWAGIKVYRNVSTTEQLGFELVVAPYLTSWQGGGAVNILATEADYPAIIDLDGDGDLDILTFGVMGTFIEKHVNYSMERYGCRDSLVFERTDLCWGRVAESDENNLMYLDTCVFGRGLTFVEEDVRHRGATVAVRDLDGDGLLDLLLADVDYPGLTALYNGGDTSQALMVRQEDFPPQEPVQLYAMPVPFFTDVNNDGLEDLLVSPFDPDPMASVGKESVWLYLNQGTNEHPDYQLYTKSFLQNEMLDFGTGAYPVVVDWDGDGLKDVVVGTISENSLIWLQNIGTSIEPKYQISSFPFDFGDFTGLVPTFNDMDGDGDQELLVGTAEGRLLLYDHDGTLLDDDFLHYDKAWSAPCFFDVDQDGIMDLVVGNETGKLSFYQGIVSGTSLRGAKLRGATWQSSTTQNEYWGEVDVCDHSISYYGYSVPTLFKYGDEILLAVGSESGKVFLFDGVTTEEGAVFREASDRWPEFCAAMPESFGMRSSVAVANLDGDVQLELMVGNFSGGLQLFNASIAVENLGISEVQDDATVMIFPNPVQSQIHIVTKADELRRLLVMDLFGRKLMEKPVQGKEAVLEVAALKKGVYLLTLVCDRGLVNRIFFKR